MGGMNGLVNEKRIQTKVQILFPQDPAVTQRLFVTSENSLLWY